MPDKWKGNPMTPDELFEFTGQIDRRITRVETEVDNLLSIKKWVMGLVAIFIVQLMGFVYGYGGMAERLDNTVTAVELSAADRFYRSEAITLENNLRREIGDMKKLMLERRDNMNNRMNSLEKRLDKVEDTK